MKESKRQKLKRIIASIMTMILVFTQFPIDGTHLSYATDDDPEETPTVESVSISNASRKTIISGSIQKNTVTLKAVATMSDGSPYTGEFEWNSDNDNIAKVSNQGVVTAGDEAGTANIIASVGEIKSVSCQIIVKKLAVTAVAISGNEVMTPGEQQYMKVIYSLNDGTAIDYYRGDLGADEPVWRSGDDAIAVFDNNGNLSANDYGETTISVSVNRVNEEALTDSRTIKVKTKIEGLTFMSPDSDVISYEKGHTVDLKVQEVGDSELTEAERKKLKWESSSENIIRLTGDGVDNTGRWAKAVIEGRGDVTITATLEKTGFFVSKNFSVRETVQPPTITIENGKQRFYNGEAEIDKDFFKVEWPEGVDGSAVCSDIVFTAESPDANVSQNGCKVTAKFICDSSYAVPDVTIYGFKIYPKTLTMTAVTITGEREYEKDNKRLPENVQIIYSFDHVEDRDLGKVIGTGISFELDSDSVGNNVSINRTGRSWDFKLEGDRAHNYTCSYNRNAPIISRVNITRKTIVISSNGITKESDGNTNVVLTNGTPEYIAVGLKGEKIEDISVRLSASANTALWSYTDFKPGKAKEITGPAVTDFTVSGNVALYAVSSNVTIVGDIEFAQPSDKNIDLTAANPVTGKYSWYLDHAKDVMINFPEAVNLASGSPKWYSGTEYADDTFKFAEYEYSSIRDMVHDDDNEDDRFVEYLYVPETAMFVEVTDKDKIEYIETDVKVPLEEGKDKSTMVYIKKNGVYYGPINLHYAYDKSDPEIDDYKVNPINGGAEVKVFPKDQDDLSGFYSIHLATFGVEPAEEVLTPEFIKLNGRETDTIVLNRTQTSQLIYALLEDKAGNYDIIPVDSKLINDRNVPTLSIVNQSFEIEENYHVDNNLKKLSIKFKVEDYDATIKKIDSYLYDGREKPTLYGSGKNEYEDKKFFPRDNNEDTKEFTINLSGTECEGYDLTPGYQLRIVIVAEDFATNKAWYVVSYKNNHMEIVGKYDSQSKFEEVIKETPTFALDGEPVMSVLDVNQGAEENVNEYKGVYYFDASKRTISINYAKLGFSSICIDCSDGKGSKTHEGVYEPVEHCYVYASLMEENLVFEEQVIISDPYGIQITVPDALNGMGTNRFPFGTLTLPEQNRRFVVDATAPTVKIDISPKNGVNRGGTYYYDGDVTATITIKDPHLPDLIQTVSGDYIADPKYCEIYGQDGEILPKPSWDRTTDSEGANYIITGTIVFKEDADYHRFTVSATDLTLRDRSTDHSGFDFVIDTIEPTFDISYSNPTNPIPEGSKYYYGLEDGTGAPTDVVATITLVERNLFYDVAEKGLKVYKIDPSGDEEVVDFWELSWEPKKSIGENRNSTSFNATACVTIPGKDHDGEYRIELDYADIVGHDMVGANDGIKNYVKDGLYEGKEHINVIDTIRPEAVFSITELDDLKYSFHDDTDHADYYNKEFTASFNVVEKNFKDGARFLHAEWDKDGVSGNIAASEGIYSYTVEAVSANEAGYHFSISGNDLAMNKLKVVEGTGWTENDELTAKDGDYFISGKKVLDVTRPVVRLDIDPLGADKPGRQKFEGTTRYYFNDAFNAKFTIWEKNFYNDYVTPLYGYNGTATNYAADKVDVRFDLGNFENNGDRSPNEYKLTEQYTEQGLYQFSIEGEDKAGNKLKIYRYSEDAKEDGTDEEDEFEDEGQKKKDVFTSYVVAIDQSHPSLVDIEIGDFYKAKLFWVDDVPHYNVYVNHPYQKIDNTTVKFIRSDKSPANITYDIVSTVRSQSRTNDTYSYGYSEDENGNGYVCTARMDGQQVFYIANIVMTDYAGNVLRWDGPSNKIYLDVTPPNHDELAPTAQPVAIANGSGRGPDGNPLFASDVDVRVRVEDPNEVVSSSGLYQIFYRVMVNGEDMTGTTTPTTTAGTAGGGIVSFFSSGPNYSEGADTTNEELIYRSELNFHFDKNTYNYNDIKIYVWGGDDAGNEIPESNAAYYAFGIDSTKPTIDVSYDNNDVINEKYFNANRMATVTVTERNFDPSRTIIATEAGVRISGWEYRRGGSANGDDDKWVSHVHYDHDGAFTFDVTALDLVGNEADPANYGESKAPKAFVVDKTAPVINVKFDNNNVRNGKYYNKKRIADVEIIERNFNATDVRLVNTASLDGNRIASPRLGEWAGTGDTRRASMNYSADGDYTLQIEYTDMAGNVAEKYVADPFTIDTTAPELLISGVEDKHAYNDKAAPSIEYSDLNLDSSSAKVDITGTLHSESGRVELVKTEEGNGGNMTCSDIPHKKENDDIYKIVGVIRDLAGNETRKELVFSVNRFGSNYIVSDETQKLIDKVYINKEQSIHVTEINVSDLGMHEIEKAVNGNIYKLTEGTDYTLEVSKPGWVQYDYEISAENFAEEGSYVVTLYSEDTAANKNSNRSVRDENGINELPIEFVVDKTAPSIIISGIEENGRYYDHERIIKLHYEDNNLATRLEVTDASGKVTVYYLGAYYDGSEDSRDIRKVAPASEYIAIMPNAEGDIELRIQALNHKQSISIKAIDAAGNEVEISSPKFLLTTNLFVQFINNTAAIVFALVVLALAIAIVLVIIQRRRKKNNA